MNIKQLSAHSLTALAADVEIPRYPLNTVTSSIVHIGVGNFHRAHQAVYSDTLLNMGETRWGITGVSLRSSDMRDNLAPQGYLYTLAILAEKPCYRVIGSIKKILVGPENPSAVINTLASKQTTLVTTTITEKGYYIDNGEIDFSHLDLVHDITSLTSPKTAYGYICAAIIKRQECGKAPLTILCCDNLHAGGQRLKQGVKTLLEHHCPSALNWLDQNISFCSSMVDRVTPTTQQSLINTVTNKIGAYDSAPVSTEPFTQWIIENNFAGPRPPFDLAGAMFVNDITPYEHIKLRFLNAAHSILATLGYLVGAQYIHETLQHPSFADFTKHALKYNVMPVTQAPSGLNSEDYIHQVFERFSNSSLPYAVLQVGTDSSQKIQQRWFPTIDDALAHKSHTEYLAFAVAAWVCFIRKAVINNELNDPLLHKFSLFISEPLHSDVVNFLTVAGADKFRFFHDDALMTSIVEFHQLIHEKGIERAINALNTNLLI